MFLLESGNPNAASVGKIGRNFPIDASTSPADRLPRQHQRDLDDVLPVEPGHHLRHHHHAQQQHHDDSRISRFYLADLPTLGTTPIGTPAPFAWGGHGQVPVDVLQRRGIGSLDWVRLVDVQPSLCRTIAWTGGGATVNIYLDDNTSARTAISARLR